MSPNNPRHDMKFGTVDRTIGILGGGQLGMMSAQAAQKMGVRTVIFTPHSNSPASRTADETIIAPYDDRKALKAFAQKVDVITYEFENIPVETVRFLKTITPVYPDDALLDVTQDRLKEKAYLNKIGLPTARWAPVRDVPDIWAALQNWRTDKAVLKTTRFGYDGKGQAVIRSEEDIENAWHSLNADIINTLIIEEMIDFECEISVIAARDRYGDTVTYPPSLNEHKNGILHQSTAPSGLPRTVLDHARVLGEKLAESVGLRGVLALELFVTRDGTLLANEIAPRTHNSGHWTIEACAVSQFENHVRTVCGLPALPPAQHSPVKMINLIGDDIRDLGPYKAMDNAHIHDYGKDTIKPDRKMGHVTILGA